MRLFATPPHPLPIHHLRPFFHSAINLKWNKKKQQTAWCPPTKANGITHNFPFISLLPLKIRLNDWSVSVCVCVCVRLKSVLTTRINIINSKYVSVSLCLFQRTNDRWYTHSLRWKTNFSTHFNIEIISILLK